MDRLAHITQNPALQARLSKAGAYGERNRRNTYVRHKMATDPCFRLARSLRGRLKAALRSFGLRKYKSTLKFLGCSVINLKRRIEKLWLPGMTWENYGEWHIDHIKPVSAFNLHSRKEQRACFHFSNLQPLWGADNIRKSDKWED